MKRGIKIAGVLLALPLAAAVAVPWFLDADEFRPVLQARLSAALGREVKLGGLKLSIVSGSVTASDLSIADDPAFSASPFLRATTLEAGVELMPLLLSRKLNVTRMVIQQPQIDLVQNAAGVWNFASIGAKSAAPAGASGTAQSSKAASQLSVQVVNISNGRITLSKPASKKPPLILTS